MSHSFRFYKLTFKFTLLCWLFTILLGSVIATSLIYTGDCWERLDKIIGLLHYVIAAVSIVSLPVLMLSLIFNQWLIRVVNKTAFRMISSAVMIAIVFVATLAILGWDIDATSFHFVLPFLGCHIVFTWILKLEEKIIDTQSD